jgi:hypothetical protein
MAVRTEAAASHISGCSCGSSAANSGCASGLGTSPASPSTTAARTPGCKASNASSAAASQQHLLDSGTCQTRSAAFVSSAFITLREHGMLQLGF